VPWLDFLFGPPSHDQFAKLVMAALRKLGSGAELRYDAKQFLIDQGDRGSIWSRWGCSRGLAEARSSPRRSN
jgi:hypothetical protein